MREPSPIRFETIHSAAGVAREVRPTPDVGWRGTLPTVGAGQATVRELSRSDAPSLLRMLTTEEVMRFISPPPPTVAGFERFIEWTHREREAGRQIVYGILPPGYDEAMGLIQVRQLSPEFVIAEWGFALGSPFWGRGVFMDSARTVLDLAFTRLGVHRLEARAAVENGRGNGALRKLGARAEATLCRSLARNGAYLDQILWSILAEDWLRAKTVWSASIH